MLARIFTIFPLVGAAALASCTQEREMPYWATIRAAELNMRVGPSEDYRIEWVYRRKGLPVKVVRVMEGWRLIEDPDGAQGWVVARYLTDERGAIVTGEGESAIHEGPESTSGIRWVIEPGVVGSLGDCEDGWCEFAVEGRAGYVPQDRLWGAGAP